MLDSPRQQNFSAVLCRGGTTKHDTARSIKYFKGYQVAGRIIVQDDAGGVFCLALAPISGARYNRLMRVIARRTLREFWEKHPDARQALQAWYADVKRADWKSPAEIKAIYRNASFVANNRVVFNVKGNQYRLIVAVQYQHGIVYIRFVGTHQEYDRIDAANI